MPRTFYYKYSNIADIIKTKDLGYLSYEGTTPKINEILKTINEISFNYWKTFHFQFEDKDLALIAQTEDQINKKIITIKGQAPYKGQINLSYNQADLNQIFPIKELGPLNFVDSSTEKELLDQIRTKINVPDNLTLKITDSNIKSSSKPNKEITVNVTSNIHNRNLGKISVYFHNSDISKIINQNEMLPVTFNNIDTPKIEQIIISAINKFYKTNLTDNDIKIIVKEKDKTFSIEGKNSYKGKVENIKYQNQDISTLVNKTTDELYLIPLLSSDYGMKSFNKYFKTNFKDSNLKFSNVSDNLLKQEDSLISGIGEYSGSVRVRFISEENIKQVFAPGIIPLPVKFSNETPTDEEWIAAINKIYGIKFNRDQLEFKIKNKNTVSIRGIKDFTGEASLSYQNADISKSFTNTHIGDVANIIWNFGNKSGSSYFFNSVIKKLNAINNTNFNPYQEGEELYIDGIDIANNLMLIKGRNNYSGEVVISFENSGLNNLRDLSNKNELNLIEVKKALENLQNTNNT